MKHFFIYITKESNYELLKQTLALAFSIEFTDRESSWWGEYALWRGDDNHSVKIYPNYVEGEGYHEEDRQDSPYLIEIPERDDPEYIKELISSLPVKFELVRHNEI